jgi:hypothetical protein
MSEPTDKKSTLPVPSGPVITHRREGVRPGNTSSDGNDATYAAQLLGGGEKRGLKGGPETLDRAKSTYLKSEYSGPNDRRPRPGRVTKTEI